MPTDEVDSGVDSIGEMSGQDSPANTNIGGSAAGDDPIEDELVEPGPSTSTSGRAALNIMSSANIPSIEDVQEELEDYDETLGERLLGLTEMFPDSLRKSVVKMTCGTISSIKSIYSFGRSAAWVVFSSSIILVAPVVFEMERSQMEEIAKQQQRQILLGPGAALSGSPGMMPMVPPPPPSQR